MLEDGIDTRVVSLPSMYNFDKLEESEKEEIFGASYENRISIEMLSSFGWHKYSKHVFGIDTFGDSAPMNDVVNYFGFNASNIKDKIRKILNK